MRFVVEEARKEQKFVKVRWTASMSTARPILAFNRVPARVHAERRRRGHDEEVEKVAGGAKGRYSQERSAEANDGGAEVVRAASRSSPREQGSDRILSSQFLVHDAFPAYSQ